MKVIELLNLNKDILMLCNKLGIRTNDVQYIDLYNDYCKFVATGDKKSYIIAVLAERYKISERKVYMLIKHFQTDYDLNKHIIKN